MLAKGLPNAEMTANEARKKNALRFPADGFKQTTQQEKILKNPRYFLKQ